MTRIETELYRQDADDLVGVKVIVYDDNNQEIENVIVVDEYDFNRLQNNLINHDHDQRYIKPDQVDQVIYPLAEEIINQVIQIYYFPTFFLEDNGDLYMEYR